jgi:hypothetical protein
MEKIYGQITYQIYLQRNLLPDETEPLRQDDVLWIRHKSLLSQVIREAVPE